jgi:hypothetical protein
MLATADQRREADGALDVATAAKKPFTVMDHEAFRESIATRPDKTGDEIDELVDELRNASRP